MNFSQVKKWVIPEGNVTQVKINDIIVWIAKKLEHFASTLLPFTLVGSMDDYLKELQIYGNSIQATELQLYKDSLWQDGYINFEGSYPTISTDFPNSKHFVIKMKAGDQIKMDVISSPDNYGRVRYINPATNTVLGTIASGNNDGWVTSINTESGGFRNTILYAIQDVYLGFVHANGITNEITSLLWQNAVPRPSKKLPDGYTQLEYLESTGTQWIALPLVFDATDEIYTRFSVNTTQTSDKYIVAPTTWNPQNNRFGLGVHQTYHTFAFGATTTGYSNLIPRTVNDGNLHTWSYKNRICTVEDLNTSLDVTDTTFSQTTDNLKLFFGYNSPTSGKVACYRHKKADGMEINLIPARRNSDNVLGMYDLVSNTFLTNAGTGEFIAGASFTSTSTPIPIESVGDKTKNLFDGKTDIVIGKYIVSATGVVGDSRYNYYCDTYFEVKPNIPYVFWGEKKADNTLSAYNRIHWYNSAKTFISSAQYGQRARCVGIAPSNAKYARISCNTLDNNLTLTQEDVNSFNWYFGEGDTLTGYEPYGYKVPIEIKGKNLADINSVIVGEYVNARSTDADFGSIKYNMAWARTDYIEIEPNTTYTIYFDDIVAASSAGLCIYDKNKNVLDGYSTNSLKTNTHNITTPENSKYLIMSISRTGSITRELAIYKQDGTYANIPYTPPVTQTIYLNEPLRKIGEYADTMSVEGTEATVTRNVGKVTYTETNDWRVQNTGLANSLAPYIYGQNPADMNRELPIYPNLLRCDVLTNALAGSSGGATMNGISPNSSRGNMLMNVELDKFPTLDDWKEYVRLNPLVIYYVLNAPTTTETYSLPQPLYTVKGSTVLDITTNIKPSKIEGDYWKQ